MTSSPTIRPHKLVANVLLALLVAYSHQATAVDDIDQPAGDIGDTYDEANDPTMVDIPSDGSAPDLDLNKDDAAVESYDDADQMGPVWESYNSNMKSVAQEVTKGLRVEDVVEPPTEYHYAAFGKPDPFVPPMITAREQDVATVSSLEVPIVSPLQAHELSALSLVGIWQLSSGERKALVMAPPSTRVEGGRAQGIIVRNGDPIGKNGGKILAIGETYLTVREFRLAVDGTRQYEDVTMQMGARDSEPSGKIRFVPGSEKTEIIPESDRSVVIQSGGGVAAQQETAPVNTAPPIARLIPEPRNNAADKALGEPQASPAGLPASPAATPIGAPADAAIQPAVVPPAETMPNG